MKTTSGCRYCGGPLPPRINGRGKFRFYCCHSHQVLYSWRQRHPRVTNKQRRETIAGERRSRRWKATDCAWLAAMFDGEGYLGLCRHRRNGVPGYYFPMLHVYNTNEQIVRHAAMLLGEDVKVFIKNPGLNCKTPYAVKVSRAAMVPVLKAIRPYLVGKQRQADILIDFCTLRDSLSVRTAPPDEYRAWYDEMKALNRRGVPQEV